MVSPRTWNTLAALLLTKGPVDRGQIVSTRSNGQLALGKDAFSAVEQALNQHHCEPPLSVERVGTNGTLKLGRAWGYVATVVIGHETMRCGVGDAHSTLLRTPAGTEVVAKVQHGNIDVLEPDDTLQHAADLLVKTLATAEVTPEHLRCIVLAVPGPVSNGQVVGEVWPQWEHKDVSAALRRRLGTAYKKVPVEIENDANAAAVGEYFHGAGRGSRALLGVKVSGGVGAGLVQDGVLYRGGHGTAGELGHDYVTVDWIKAERNSKKRPRPHHLLPPGLHELSKQAPCHRCGGKAHVEAYTSGTAIIHRLYPEVGNDKRPDLYTRRIEDIMRVLREGGPDHDRISVAIADAGFVLGEALVPLINFADPDVVVLTGAMRDAGPQYIQKVQQRVRDRASALVGSEPAFHLSEDDWSGVRGAIRLGLERHAPQGIPLKDRQAIRSVLEASDTNTQAAIPLLGPTEPPGATGVVAS